MTSLGGYQKIGLNDGQLARTSSYLEVAAKGEDEEHVSHAGIRGHEDTLVQTAGVGAQLRRHEGHLAPEPRGEDDGVEVVGGAVCERHPAIGHAGDCLCDFDLAERDGGEEVLGVGHPRLEASEERYPVGVEREKQSQPHGEPAGHVEKPRGLTLADAAMNDPSFGSHRHRDARGDAGGQRGLCLSVHTTLILSTGTLFCFMEA